MGWVSSCVNVCVRHWRGLCDTIRLLSRPGGPQLRGPWRRSQMRRESPLTPSIGRVSDDYGHPVPTQGLAVAESRKQRSYNNGKRTNTE